MCEESLKHHEALKIGQLVMSTAGHDTNCIYVVYKKIEDNHIYVVDGKYKTTQKPKRKNIKHLQKLSQCVDGHLDDLTIKRVIKQYLTKRQK